MYLKLVSEWFNIYLDDYHIYGIPYAQLRQLPLTPPHYYFGKDYLGEVHQRRMCAP